MDNIVFVIDMTDKRNQYLAEDLSQDCYSVEEYNEDKSYGCRAVYYIFVFAPARVIDMPLAEKINSSGMIFCLECKEEIKEYLKDKDVKTVKFFDDEVLAMQNAYLTAEGALALIIENTATTLKNSNVLVLGYGRLGKTMTRILKNNEANVYVATHSITERAMASVVADYVCTIANCKKHFCYFTTVVNTVPAKILKLKELSLLDKDCFILDLASNPGGVDFPVAEEIGIKALHALGIPGKTAPKTAADHIRASIYKILFESKEKGKS